MLWGYKPGAVFLQLPVGSSQVRMCHLEAFAWSIAYYCFPLGVHKATVWGLSKWAILHLLWGFSWAPPRRALEAAKNISSSFLALQGLSENSKPRSKWHYSDLHSSNPTRAFVSISLPLVSNWSDVLNPFLLEISWVVFVFLTKLWTIHAVIF